MNTQLPPVRPMKLTFGGRVPDEDIIGRDETADSLWEDLEANSIQISEMRRFGKSTLLRLMEMRAPEGWICVRTSVQDARSTADLIELTLQELLLHANVKERIKKNILSMGQHVDGIDVNAHLVTFHLSPEFKQSASQTFRSVLESLAIELRKDNLRMVIMWDEFPDAIDAIRRAESSDAARNILALLKANRQSDDGQYLRWVLTGSVGFHHVQRFLGGHGQEMGDVTTRDMGPLTNEWTRWFAASLLLGMGLDADESVVNAIADISGGIPFVVEMMVKFIRDNRNRNQKTLPHNLSSARRLLLESAGDSAIGAGFTPLLTKVDDYYGDLASLAETVLDDVARSPQTVSELTNGVKDFTPTPSEHDIRQVLELLVDDHYLLFDYDSNTYSWRHPPLQLIWQAKRRNA